MQNLIETSKSAMDHNTIIFFKIVCKTNIRPTCIKSQFASFKTVEFKGLFSQFKKCRINCALLITKVCCCEEAKVVPNLKHLRNSCESVKG